MTKKLEMLANLRYPITVYKRFQICIKIGMDSKQE